MIALSPKKVMLTPNKSRVQHDSIIATPEAHYNSSVCMIQKAGKGCHSAIRDRRIALTNFAFSERKMQSIDEESGTFICNAYNIFAVVTNQKVFPLGGDRILIRRHVEEKKWGDIVIPEGNPTTDQTLDGEIVQFGLPYGAHDKRKVRGLKIGDKIRLAKWEHHMIDLQFLDGYHIIVKEEDIIAIQ